MARRRVKVSSRRSPFIITIIIHEATHLPDPRAEDEVGGTLNANARLQEGLETVPLPAEAVYDFSAYKIGVRIR